MTEEKTPELPIVEEPKAEEQKVNEPAVDVDGLIAELEKAGITNTQELQGKLDAGSQVGRMAELLGQERKRNEELTARLENPAPKPQNDFDLDEYGEGQPLDIEAVVVRSVDKALTAREKKMAQVQQAQLQAYQRIKGDEDYHLVASIWEQKEKDPAFIFGVQNGSVNPVDEYTSIVRNFYKGLVQKSHDTIKTLTGGEKVKQPHVETGERSSGNIVSEEPGQDEASKYRAALKEKVNKGQALTSEEELALVDSIFDQSA